MTRYCPKSESMPFTLRSYFASGFELLPGLKIYQHQLPPPINTVLSLVETEAIERLLENDADRKILLDFFSAEEQELFAAYSYRKRQREWLAGRIVCKYAVLQLLHESVSVQQFPAFSVLPDKNGAPVLSFSDPKRRVPSVSITHSGRYAVAMAGIEGSCGVDIQKVSAKIINVVSRFAAPEELELLASNMTNMSEEERLTLLWSAKEAMKKSLLHDQPVIFQGMHLKRLSTGKVTSMCLGSSVDEVETDVTALLLDDYALAYTASGVKHA